MINSILIGDLILDNYVFGSVERISPEAPIPVLNHIEQKLVLGGALNVGSNLNNLGNNTHVIGIIGKDEAGDSICKLMKEDGISSEYIVRDKNTMTSKKTRFITNSQQLLRWDVEKNAYSERNEKNLIKKIKSLIKKTDFVVISDYKKGVCSKNLLHETIKIANEGKIKVFIDPKGSDFNKYKKAYCITPNILETKAVYNKPLVTNKNFENACKFICDTFDIETCIITRGKDGMTIYDSENYHHIKSNVKDVFDVSGAGDTVVATLSTYHTKGKTLIDAAKIANLAAQHVVSKFGTTPINQEELNSYL